MYLEPASKDLRGNPKTRVSPDRTGPDRTETIPGSGHVFENIFGSGIKIFGSARVRVFFTGVSYIFSENLENNMQLNENHASYSQLE